MGVGLRKRGRVGRRQGEGWRKVEGNGRGRGEREEGREGGGEGGEGGVGGRRGGRRGREGREEGEGGGGGRREGGREEWEGGGGGKRGRWREVRQTHMLNAEWKNGFLAVECSTRLTRIISESQS